MTEEIPNETFGENQLQCLIPQDDTVNRLVRAVSRVSGWSNVRSVLEAVMITIIHSAFSYLP